MALTPEESQELAGIENELKTRQSAPVPGSKLTAEEAFELTQIEQELSSRQGMQKVNPDQEADLGFVNRLRYSIDPFDSNKKALLAQEYGEENVKQDEQGNLFVQNGGQFRPVNKEGFSFSDVTDFAGALPEMVGGAVGAVGGAVGGGGIASIPAAIGLGAAGGAVGSTARQGLSALLGTPQVATKGERATEVGLSALTGGLFGGGVQAVKVGAKAASPYVKSAASSAMNTFKKTPGIQTVADVASSTTKATKSVVDSITKNFSPNRAVDAEDFLKIADELGVDKSILPESVEYGERSFVSKLGRVVTEGPSGEERFNNFAKAQLQVTNAVDDSIGKISPYRPTSKDEAGQFLVDSVNEAKTKFFSNLDDTYGTIIKNTPGIKMRPESQRTISSKLLGLERFAKGEVARGIGSQKQEGQSLLQAVRALRNTNGSFKQTVEGMQRIGRAAFEKGGPNRLPVDKVRLQKLWKEIHEVVIDDIRYAHGDDVADNLIRNNSMISDFLGEDAVLSKVIGKDSIAPEKVFQSLIENGDTRKIEALMAIMPPEKVQSVKAALLDSIIKRNPDGLVLYDSTANVLKNKKEIIAKLFTPEELEPLGKALKLGRRMGNPVMSTSGTGASNAFNDFINRAKGAVFNEATLDMAKKAGSKTVKPTIKTSARSVIPASARNPGVIGNLLTDNSQRGGSAYMGDLISKTGGAAEALRLAKEKERRQGRSPGGKK